jgi:hypothetical protein
MKEIIEALAFIYTEHDENPYVLEWVNQENVSLPLAFAVSHGYATLTDSGAVKLRETYNYAQQVAEELGLEGVYDLVDVEEEIPKRSITITVGGGASGNGPLPVKVNEPKSK